MPVPTEDINSGYHVLMRQVYSLFQEQTSVEGSLALIYDKNKMEASGYAAAMADVFKEKVYSYITYNTQQYKYMHSHNVTFAI